LYLFNSQIIGRKRHEDPIVDQQEIDGHSSGHNIDNIAKENSSAKINIAGEKSKHKGN
jgi:hypothetical protein